MSTAKVRAACGAFIVCVFAFAPNAASPARAALPIAECEPVQELDFVCGAERPEDLARIPGTKWLIASGFSNGAGLKLVDTENKSLRTWYVGERKQNRFDRKTFEHCPGPLDVALFNVQGISLRSNGSMQHTLYATNHGGRETIEVFAVDARGPEPALTWIGCVPMPSGTAANSVAAFSDGTILATVLTHPGTTITDFVNGKITGGVYEWRRGSAGFRLLVGTELPGNNGVETSKDDMHFYVVAFGWHSILEFSRVNTSHPTRKVEAPGFMPDNIHWDGDRLIAAGMQLDEPVCGGRRKIIDGQADMMRCHRGYVVAQLDPKTLAFTILAYAEPNKNFNGVSAAVIVDRKLWLASYQADRIAYRSLPISESEHQSR